MALITTVDQIHFRNDDNYLDVELHIEGGCYLELKTDGSFFIESEKEIDIICNKLKELLQGGRAEERKSKKK